MNSLKDTVLCFLRSNQGDYISGAALAKSAGVSRAAVNKAVSALKAEGYLIDAVSNRGYLLHGGDVLSATEIMSLLSEDLKDVRVETKRLLPSTNATAREKAAAGEKELYCVVCAEQSAGRGRMGRSFFSPEGTGVYLSVLLRPLFEPQKATLITTTAAVSVCEALEKLGVESPKIKWVNDVFVNDKKVCGILTEASLGLESGKLDYAVLGVGINLYEPKNGFPDDIKSAAGAVFETGQDNLKNRFTAYFLNSFIHYYKKLPESSPSDGYAARSLVTGKDIIVISGDRKENAKAISIDNECRLLVELGDKSRKYLSSGEISIRLNN